jgi:hypothetical protein
MRITDLIRKIFRIKINPSVSPFTKGRNREEEAPRNNAIEEINQVLSRTNERLAKLEGDLAKAVTGYRRMLIKENPEVLAELIDGESIEALDKSLANARELTEKVKQKLAEKTAAEWAPAGAPPRSPPDTAGMSPGEKIRYGLTQK